MPSLIKDGAIVQDTWTLIKEATGPEVLMALRGKNIIVPLPFWQLYHEELESQPGAVGIWLASDELVESIKTQLFNFPLVALHFPVFTDGRAYSNARQLRQEYGYAGEIRAFGDVLRDQLFYMQQCGFTSFALRHDQDTESCLSAFADFQESYQATMVKQEPLFRRR
ncbi:MAG: hypothetical protein ACI95C_000550 [Pseudohongiellaceae bacterium]|jgi:uncharacterized protein (DUF934 family)